MIQNGRWRGRMPFRSNHNQRPETIKRQGRTGEPSPAPSIPRWFGGEFAADESHGKSEGSFTEKVNLALLVWMKNKYGSTSVPLTFQYRLHRRKTITVTGMMSRIVHLKRIGRGSKGFFLRIKIVSINGAPPAGIAKLYNFFALNKIIAQENPAQMLALAEKKAVPNSTALCIFIGFNCLDENRSRPIVLFILPLLDLNRLTLFSIEASH